MSTPETSTIGPEGAEPPPAEQTAPPAPLRAGRVWAFALAGAIAAGLGAFAIGEAAPRNAVRASGQHRQVHGRAGEPADGREHPGGRP